jgi:hypothetical protein
VGAKLCGQASFSTPTSKWTLLIFAIAESLLPVIPIIMSQKALGMVLITHDETLQGIFTDGDLRRVLETLALNSNSLPIYAKVSE